MREYGYDGRNTLAPGARPRSPKRSASSSAAEDSLLPSPSQEPDPQEQPVSGGGQRARTKAPRPPLRCPSEQVSGQSSEREGAVHCVRAETQRRRDCVRAQCSVRRGRDRTVLNLSYVHAYAPSARAPAPSRRRLPG